MTSKQLQIIQHSLGCDQYGQGTRYRNRYVVGPGCDSFDDCRALCEQGLMRDHGPQQIAGGMHCFCVTDEGVQAMMAESPKPPKVSRGRRRYLAFLRADSGLTFIEWLKRYSKEVSYE